MNEVAVLEKVVKFLVSITGQNTITAGTDLQESELIDSLTMMDLLVFIETEFGVRLDFGDLTPDVFQTPATLSRLINDRISNSK